MLTALGLRLGEYVGATDGCLVLGEIVGNVVGGDDEGITVGIAVEGVTLGETLRYTNNKKRLIE